MPDRLSSGPTTADMTPLRSDRIRTHATEDRAAAAGSVDQVERAGKWVVLALVGTAVFMTTLDSSIVNISLPAISVSFGVPLSGATEWILIGYLVVIASILLTFGRLSDELGRKPLFLGGLAVFTVGSAICGAAPTLGALIASRCFQGLGAAAIFSVNVAMITRSFPPAERGRALGINMVVVGLGVSAGPTIGGILTETLGWRWIFYVNLPIGVVAISAAWRLLTERRKAQHQRFDLPGAALLAVGLAALTLGLSFGQEWGWSSPRFLTSMAITAAALVGVVWVERRTPAPIVSPALLRNRLFVLGNLTYMICMLALFAVGFLLPFYLEELRGFGALQAGLMLTPLPLTLGLVAPASGALADRVGSRWLAPLGLFLASIGLFLLSRLTQASQAPYLILALVVTGIGQGIFQSPNARAIMGAAPVQQQGIASGTYATVRVIGQSLSIAVAGAVFTSLGGAAAGTALAAGRATLSAGQVQALQQTFVRGIHAAFVVCAAVAAVGVVTALVRGAEADIDDPGR